VFDRIRENVPRLPRATFSQIVNRSMSEVLTRSLITGLSSVFLVTVLFIFGGATLKDFAFALIVGIASGAYSSIFIAAPLLAIFLEREPGFVKRRHDLERSGEVSPPVRRRSPEPVPVPATAGAGDGGAPPVPASEAPSSRRRRRRAHGRSR
jgi:SecD/SecF fusion protein